MTYFLLSRYTQLEASDVPRGGGTKKSRDGVIGGGTAAGVIVLVALAFLLFRYCRRGRPSSSDAQTSRPDLAGDGPPGAYVAEYSQVGTSTAEGAGIEGATPWTPDESDVVGLGPQEEAAHSALQANPPQTPSKSPQQSLFVSPGAEAGPLSSMSPTNALPGPSPLGTRSNGTRGLRED